MADHQRQPLSNEETINAVAEQVKTRGGTDRFIVRVWKRRGVTGLVEEIAVAQNATAYQIGTASIWLAQLAGGGEYRLEVAHTDAPTTRIGDKLTFTIGGPVFAVPNANAPSRTDWTGPDITILNPNSPLGAGFVAATPQTVQQGYAPPNGSSQQQQQQQVAPPPLTGGVSPQQDSWVRDQEARLRAREQELSTLQAKIARDQSEKESELRRMESENRLRAEIAKERQELEAKLTAAAQPRGNDLKDLVSALVPLATVLFQQSATSKLEMMKLQQETAQRTEALAREQAAESRKMFELMMSKPAITPEMQMLIETLKSQGSSGMEMMSKYMEAASMVSRQSVTMIETIASLQLGGEPDHPALLAVREVVSALKALGTGAGQAARKMVIPQAQPQQHFAGLPAGQQAQQQVQQPQAQQQAQGQRTTTVRLRTPSLDDDPVSMLEHAIRAHHDPLEVAKFLFTAIQMKHPRMLKAIHDAGGDPETLFVSRLGTDWFAVPANAQYAMQLGPIVQKIGTELGLYVTEAPQAAAQAAEVLPGAPEGAVVEAAGADDEDEDEYEDDEEDDAEISPA